MKKALKELSRTLRIPFNRWLAFRRLRKYHAAPHRGDRGLGGAFRPDNQVYHFWKKVKQGQVVEEFVNDPQQCGFGIVRT